jgi:uncharacterized DUF497 family protein
MAIKKQGSFPKVYNKTGVISARNMNKKEERSYEEYEEK